MSKQPLSLTVAGRVHFDELQAASLSLKRVRQEPRTRAPAELVSGCLDVPAGGAVVQG